MFKLSNKSLIGIFFLLILGWIFSSCSSDSSEAQQQAVEAELPDNGISITEAWARPGRENGVSAIYFIVANGSAKTDTLLSISSPAAGLVELHETYELEGDMMGMRKSETPQFPGRSTTTLRPGGLHVMLMQLNRPLQEGDEIELSMVFSLAGEITISAPVRGMN